LDDKEVKELAILKKDIYGNHRIKVACSQIDRISGCSSF